MTEQHTTGDSPVWTVRHCDDYLLIEIDPELMDITNAIEALIPADRRRFWLVQAVDSDDPDIELWKLERVPAPAPSLVTN